MLPLLATTGADHLRRNQSAAGKGVNAIDISSHNGNRPTGRFMRRDARIKSVARLLREDLGCSSD
jgi:hypothetical protein